LEQTIQSVLDQNYPNVEYIIIDGGSKDASVSIIKKYEKHLKYWVSEPDRGQTHAINKGFSKATGQIFNWLNSDDYYVDNVFEKVNSHFQNPEVDVVMGKSLLFDHHTGHQKLTKGGHLFSSLERTIGDALLDQPSAFFRTTAFSKLIPLDEEFRFLMDRVMWVKYLITQGTDAVKKVDETFVNFRLHESSKTVSEKNGFLLERNGIYASLSSYLGNAEQFKVAFDELACTRHPIQWPIEIINFDSLRAISEFIFVCAQEKYAEADFNKSRRIMDTLNPAKLSPTTQKHYRQLKHKLRIPNFLIAWIRGQRRK